MAGLVPAIHAFWRSNPEKTWMPGTSPGMTSQIDSLTHLRRGERLRIEKTLEHVGGQPRDVVVEAVVGEAARVGDRAGGERSTPVRAFEEHHVGADRRV